MLEKCKFVKESTKIVESVIQYISICSLGLDRFSPDLMCYGICFLLLYKMVQRRPVVDVLVASNCLLLGTAAFINNEGVVITLTASVVTANPPLLVRSAARRCVSIVISLVFEGAPVVGRI